MAASWLLENKQEEGGHQAMIFGLLGALLLAATWAIETLAPFKDPGGPRRPCNFDGF